MFKLGFIDGWVCVVETESRSDKPELFITYWPCFRDAREVWEVELGTELHRSSLMYPEYSGRIAGGFHRKFTLANHGETRAIRTEVIPIPAPKVKEGIETRYRNGRWEKYLKTRGWVAA